MNTRVAGAWSPRTAGSLTGVEDAVVVVGIQAYLERCTNPDDMTPLTGRWTAMPAFIWSAVMFAFAIVGGCTDPTPRLVVNAAPPEKIVTGVRQAEIGYTQVTCDYALALMATGGKPDEYALLLDAVEHWTLTTTGETAVDTLSTSDLAGLFGGTRVSVEQPLSSSEYAYWGGPFTMVRTYRYRRVAGGTDSTTFRLDCR